jgi:hypothetical protein
MNPASKDLAYPSDQALISDILTRQSLSALSVSVATSWSRSVTDPGSVAPVLISDSSAVYDPATNVENHILRTIGFD